MTLAKRTLTAAGSHPMPSGTSSCAAPDDGPWVVAAILGTLDGRWCQEFGGNLSSHDHLQHGDLDRLVADQWIGRGLKAQQDEKFGIGEDDLQLIGFALMKAWGQLTDDCHHFGKIMAKRLKKLFSRSSTCHVLQHDCSASWILDCPKIISKTVPLSGEYLWRLCDNSLMTAYQRMPGGQMASGSLSGTLHLEKTDPRISFNCKCEVWPPMWLPFGRALCIGVLSNDFTAVVPRDKLYGWKIPVQPPQSYLLALKRATNAPSRPMVEIMGAIDGDVPHRYKGAINCAVPFASELLIQGVDHSLTLKDVQRHFKTNLVSANKVERLLSRTVYDPMDPYFHEDITGEPALKKVRRPSGAVVAGARPKLDVAAMIAQRAWFASQQCGIIRHIAIDASPQKRTSYEVLNTSEIVIRVSDLVGTSGIAFNALGVDRIIRRKMPPVFLGMRGMDLAHKTDASVHQSWLEYGPTHKSLRCSLHAVRTVLTDLGCERGIANYWDIASFYMSSHRDHATISDADRNAFLYPNAIGVPGPLHIIDWLLREMLDTMSFWPALLKRIKLIAQYLHSDNHRQYLVKKIDQNSNDDDVRKRCKAALNKGSDRFAQWRWESLDAAVKSQVTAKEPFQVACEGDDPRKWHLRCVDTMKAIASAASEEKHWQELAAVSFMIEDLMDLHGWIKGCDCHEEERLAGQIVKCPRQGLRCKTFKGRLLLMMDTMQRRIDSLRPGQFGDAVEVAEVHRFMSQCLGRIELKLKSWVCGLTCSLWQARDPSVAASIIARRDQWVTKGYKVHRVVERFVGTHHGSMRESFERHAAGHGLTALLDFELASYETGILDDSFAESPHALFTKIVQHSTASKPVWWASSFRLSQNIEMKKTIERLKPGIFGLYFRKWRSVWQQDALKSRKCISDRTTGKRNVLLQRIYRVGAFAVQDISALPKVQGHFALENRVTRAEKSNFSKVLIEYLCCTLDEGGFYSFSPEGNITDLLSTELCDASSSIAKAPVLFEVIDLAAGKKIYQQCEEMDEWKKFKFPVLCKDWKISNYGGPDSRSHSVTAESASMVDLLSNSCINLTSKLLHWKTDFTETHGSLCATDPSFVHQKQWCLTIIAWMTNPVGYFIVSRFSMLGIQC